MKKFLRLLKIYRVITRYRLHELLEGVEQARLASLFLRLPFIALANPKIAKLNRGQRLRLALEELGPIFIKFGQLLSTRRDMIPEDIADELTYLQDQVPPFSGAIAQKIIETATGSPIDTIFAEFDITPLASASIAQVHTAKLLTGEEVVIKVIRPEIDRIIADDISILESLAAFTEKHIKGGKRLRPREVVDDYKHVIFNELNLLAEGANASQLKRNFENSTQLYVPKIYWDYSRENVLVMERIYGVPVSQIDAIKAANINLKKLAEIGVEIFFTQVFNHSFFHADMHPGNVFVSTQDPEHPQYIALDCAIIGTLSKQDQQYLARNLLAIFQRNYRKVAELHVACGWVPANTPINAFEATMRSVCEPIFEKPLQDISFGMLLLQLFRTASRFNMEIQPSLVLLQKTLINVEGMGKQLYPQLDLWQTALPFLENWQKKRLSPFENMKIIGEKVPEWVEQIPEAPELLFDALSEAKHAQQNMLTVLKEYEQHRAEENRKRSRQLSGLAIILLGVFILANQTALTSWFSDLSTSHLILSLIVLSLIYVRR